MHNNAYACIDVARTNNRRHETALRSVVIRYHDVGRASKAPPIDRSSSCDFCGRKLAIQK